MGMRVLGWLGAVGAVGLLGCDTQHVRAKALSVDGDRTCVETLEGQVRCWGKEVIQGGIFSRDSLEGSATPRLVTGLTRPGQLEVGGGYACALDADGGVRCWWASGSALPKPVPELPAVRLLSLNNSEGYALTRDGQAYRMILYPLAQNEAPQVFDWTGLEPLGKLGTVEQLVVGTSHQCVRTQAREVWCWGQGKDGQLGYSPSESGGRALTPRRVPELTGVVELALGAQHTCARREDGSVWCWGSNAAGQLGLPRAKTRAYEPVAVPGLTGAVQLALGAQHTCARRDDGSVWCCGDNGQGQLGDGTLEARSEPAPVVDLSGVVDLQSGFNHTCALQEAGRVSCWGSDSLSQLGLGGDDARPRQQPRPVEAGALIGCATKISRSCED